MNRMEKLFRITILIIGIVVIAFNVQLYNVYEMQKATVESIKDKQDVESEFNSNKFKYQADQIERVNKDLESAQQQIKEQKDALESQNDDLASEKDALLQEAEKRQEVENDSKAIQTSLVDIKAESDAIKDNMKSWQKDYVNVLAELEKKMDDSQAATKSLEDNLVALNIPELKENIQSMKADIEKITHPSDNSVASTTFPVSDNQVIEQHSQSSSQ